MSRRTVRVVEMTLDSWSIANAIVEIHEFRQQLTDGMNDLIRKLSQDGEEIAKMQVVSMDAVYTGYLESSIYGYFDPMKGIGYVIAGSPYAIYVEYGTGAVGAGDEPGPNGEAGEPHPAAVGNWKYDKHHHGASGWVYKSDRDGKFHWTKGYVSRPFMYNTLRWLEEAAETTGADIILKNM